MKFRATRFFVSIIAVAALGACGGGDSSSSPVVVKPTPTPTPTPTSASMPNVVFIVADDLNTYIEGMDGHPQAYTPNLKRLMARGVTFMNAQANGPHCSPSRASFLSGYLPATSGKHHGNLDFREIPLLSDAVLFPQHFRDNGYAVYGAGKIFHRVDNTVFGTSDVATQPTTRTGVGGGYVGPRHSFGPYPWDGITREWGRPARNIPYGNEGEHWYVSANGGIALYKGGRWNSDPDLPVAVRNWGLGFGRIGDPPIFRSGMNGNYPADWEYGGWAEVEYNRLFTTGPERSKLADEIITDWSSQLLRGMPVDASRSAPAAPIGDRSFMMMIGLTKTHPSLYVPNDFFDDVIRANGIQSISDVKLPPSMQGALENNDLDDIPTSLRPQYNMREYQKVLSGGREGGTIRDVVNAGEFVPNTPENLVRSMILSYLAGVYTIDVQVGKILDAIDSNPALRNNTIIVFTSDQGTHMGEKMSWSKGTLWKETFNVPLIIVDPRSNFNATRGQRSYAPVSLVDLYPTLSALAGIPQLAVPSGKPPLDGQSLVPALANPAQPAFPKRAAALSSTYGGYQDSVDRDPTRHNYSLRTERYRYILSNRGEEELYDRSVDHYEHNNVAADPRYAAVKDNLKRLVQERADF